MIWKNPAPTAETLLGCDFLKDLGTGGIGLVCGEKGEKTAFACLFGAAC